MKNINISHATSDNKNDIINDLGRDFFNLRIDWLLIEYIYSM